MDQWNCRYCMKTFHINQKDFHTKTNRHKFKARWAKYFSTYDQLINMLNEDNKLFNYSLDEYNEKENDIIKELDLMLISGLFDNLPDEE